MSDVEKTVVKALKGVMRRRKGSAAAKAVKADSDLYEDLELDSLDVAELSAVLEDDLGFDPYSDGQTPRTVAEVIDFYKS